jgi:UDP-glucose 4-epimerase
MLGDAEWWKRRRVLVTGGAGFLGSNLCHALAALGARVTALDAMLADGGANPANLEGAGVLLVRGDIRDTELGSLCQGAEVLFNMAAQTSHMGGQRDPVADIAINAVAQVRLVQAMREAAPGATVVHASTRQFMAARSACRWTSCIRSTRRMPTASANGPASSTGCWRTACSAARWSRCA